MKIKQISTGKWRLKENHTQTLINKKKLLNSFYTFTIFFIKNYKNMGGNYDLWKTFI